MRNWDQFFRFYHTVAQITGSYTQAEQLDDPEVIDALCSVRSELELKPQAPRWWRFTDEMHKLTDIADQLIASRASGKDVKFYPRPVNRAAKERQRRQQQTQEDRIEQARLENLKRRGIPRDIIKY